MTSSPHAAARPKDANLLRYAMLRVAVGWLGMATLWDFRPLLAVHYSGRGWYSAETMGSSVFSTAAGPGVTHGLFWVCMACLAYFVIGLGTRAAGALALLLLTALHLRNPLLSDADDELLRATLFLMLFAPVGAVWSLDGRRSTQPANSAPWLLTLLRFKLIFLYFASGVEKLFGDSWHDGTAIARALRNPAYARFAVPPSLDALWSIVSLGVPYFELLLSVLLVARPTRWLGVLLGVGFHLALATVMELRWFTWLLVAHYSVFLDDRQVLAISSGARAMVTRIFQPQWLQRDPAVGA